MNSAAPVASQRRSVRWWTFTLFTLTVQVGLIFWLSDPAPLRTRDPKYGPSLALVGRGCEEWLKLTEPTLFALPHLESFSGPAWLHVIPRQMPFFEWDEEPHWLKLSATNLVAAVSRPQSASDAAGWQTPAFTPAPMLPELIRPSLLEPSRLRIEGELAWRELLSKIDLPSWPALTLTPTESELLRNTVIQIVVDRSGNPVSPGALLESSGHEPADQFALACARSARFAPLTGVEANSPVSGLTWGRLVFEWRTAAPTNAP